MLRANVLLFVVNLSRVVEHFFEFIALHHVLEILDPFFLNSLISLDILFDHFVSLVALRLKIVHHELALHAVQLGFGRLPHQRLNDGSCLGKTVLNLVGVISQSIIGLIL